MIVKPFGNDMENGPVLLHFAHHAEQMSSQQSPPGTLRDIVPNHEIHVARLILQGHERHAGGARWALASDYESRRIYSFASVATRYFTGIFNIHGDQSVAQQCKRMTAEAQPQMTVIRHDILGFGRAPQQR